MVSSASRISYSSGRRWCRRESKQRVVLDVVQVRDVERHERRWPRRAETRRRRRGARGRPGAPQWSDRCDETDQCSACRECTKLGSRTAEGLTARNRGSRTHERFLSRAACPGNKCEALCTRRPRQRNKSHRNRRNSTLAVLWSTVACHFKETNHDEFEQTMDDDCRRSARQRVAERGLQQQLLEPKRLGQRDRRWERRIGLGRPWHRR